MFHPWVQQPVEPAGSFPDVIARIYHFVEPYQLFVALLIILWLVARRPPPAKEDFNRQAQQVLEEKFRRGEISRKAYEKYRQDLSLRPKR